MPGKGIEALVFLIADVVQFLNVGKTMNSAQVLATAKLLIEDTESKNLKPDDFKICFNNAKKGVYGKTFDRIDGQIIFEWVRAYVSERMDLAENMSIKLHATKLASNPIPKELVEMYAEMQRLNPDKYSLATIAKNIEEVKPDPKKEKVIVRSERDKFIQKCFCDFDDLCSDKPSLDKYGDQIKGKFTDLEVNGIMKPVDITEYTEIKLKEYDLNF